MDDIYTQGIMNDGAAILKSGECVTVDEIISSDHNEGSRQRE